MDPGYRSPFVDQFRRPDTPRDLKVLAAQGGLATTAHEQLALLLLLADDPDSEVAATVKGTLASLPHEELRAFLARADAPAEMKAFFAGMGITPASQPAGEASTPLLPDDDEDQDEGEDDEAGATDTDETKILSGLPVKKKVKLAFKGTREQRAQLIRDPNRLVASAVLSSPKLTEAEVESFAKMANVTEEVQRTIGMNRTWLKNYGVVLGLVKNPKTPPALSMQLLPRVTERDMKMVSVDRNVPEALRLAARKFIVKSLKWRVSRASSSTLSAFPPGLP
jgi:hypothetical protein